MTAPAVAERCLPGGPLLDRLRRRHGSLSAVGGPSQRRQLYRLARRGLTVEEADRWAVAFGWHPAELWGPGWAEVGL